MAKSRIPFDPDGETAAHMLQPTLRWDNPQGLAIYEKLLGHKLPVLRKELKKKSKKGRSK